MQGGVTMTLTSAPKVGSVTLSGSEDTNAHTEVDYPQSFPPTGTPPVLLSQVITYNDDAFVKSRQRRQSDANQGGLGGRAQDLLTKFQMKLESARGGPVHGEEEVGWLAIQESRESHIGTNSHGL